MCGICGFISMNDKRPKTTKTQLISMWSAAETRGRDASGIYFEDEKKDYVIKMPVSSSHLARSVPWDDVRASKICLMHTRHATQGTPANNNNNHPLVDNDMFLVHNGVISNSDDWVSRNITDSYALLESYHFHKAKTTVMKLKKSLRVIEGSASFALWNNTKRELFLVRHNNPLHVGYKGNTLYFASTSVILNKVKPEVIYPIRKDSGLHIRNNTLREFRVKFKERSFYYEPEIQDSFKWNDIDDYTQWNCEQNEGLAVGKW